MARSMIWTTAAVYLGIPLWLLLLTMFSKRVNTPGIVLYSLMLLMAGLPLSLIIVFIFGPVLSRFSGRKLSGILRIVSVHTIIAAGLWAAYLHMRSGSDAAAALMIPWYLSVGLFGPSFVGCITCLLTIDNQV